MHYLGGDDAPFTPIALHHPCGPRARFATAYSTAEGTSKFAQFQAAGPLSASTKTVMPIDPATMMMAVALFSIEQQLKNISEMGKQILLFLEVEKESEIEADVETLMKIITKYKNNWDNEHFVARVCLKTNSLQSPRCVLE